MLLYDVVWLLLIKEHHIGNSLAKPWVSIPSERRHLLWVLWSHRQPRRPSACGADLVGSTPRTTWVGAALPSQGEWLMTGDTLKMCHQNVASLKSPIDSIDAGFGGKIIYTWLIFHCHAGLPEGFCGSVVNQLNRWLVVDSFVPLLHGYVEEYHCKKNKPPEIPEIYNLLLVECHYPCKKYALQIAIFCVSWAILRDGVDSAPIKMLGKHPHCGFNPRCKVAIH